MKICTITCQNSVNHGARLQAYALATFLKNLGHEVEIIDFRPDFMTFQGKIWYWPGFSIKEWAKLFLQMGQRRTSIRKYKKFCDFSKKFLPLTNKVYHSSEELKQEPPLADIYIAGSDQIWNTKFRNGTTPAYYLDFGDSSIKRISYAASFATTELVKGTEVFVQEKLRRFDKIAVREESGLNILHQLGLSGEVVLDPAFLLSANEWNKIIDEYDTSNEDYILVYDFMKSPTVKSIALRLAQLYHCKIYAISPFKASYAHKNFLEADPSEFVRLVKNAKCVISNSFHGTVFAMIYQRDFFVIEREDGLNDRMANILSKYNLSHRLVGRNVSNETLKKSINYHVFYPLLEKDIEYSKNYLRKQLDF